MTGVDVTDDLVDLEPEAGHPSARKQLWSTHIKDHSSRQLNCQRACDSSKHFGSNATR